VKYILRYSKFLPVLEGKRQAMERFVNNGKIPQDKFEKLLSLDPSDTKKYIEKMCQWFLEWPAPVPSDAADQLGKQIAIYDRLVLKSLVEVKDINQFKSLGDFMVFVDANAKKKTRTEQEEATKKRGTEYVFENDKWLVVVSKTWASSKLYGAGTKWCTAMEDDSKFFSQYKGVGVRIYYLIRKDMERSEGDDMYKIAIAVYPTGERECFDAADTGITFDAVLSYTGLDAKIFEPKKIKMPTTEREIASWFKKNKVTKYTKNEDGTYDLDGWVSITLSFPKLPVKFGHVRGGFEINAPYITTLEGFPTEVQNVFHIQYAPLLTSLEGAPKKVGSLEIENTGLTSLEGMPEVARSINISKNLKLLDLRGMPEVVNGDFSVAMNYIKSLEGCPKKVGGNFSARINDITSLVGAPEIVVGEFAVGTNKHLTSLEGFPKYVGGSIDLSSTAITKFEHMPEFTKSLSVRDCHDLTNLDGLPRVIVGELNVYNTAITNFESDTLEGVDTLTTNLAGLSKEYVTGFLKRVGCWRIYPFQYEELGGADLMDDSGDRYKKLAEEAQRHLTRQSAEALRGLPGY
jgi:hypothetical protein